MKKWGVVAVLGVVFTNASLRADDLLIPSITLEDYTKRAVEQGVFGKENQWTLESAGYTREIAFRQTDSPTLRLDHRHTRSDLIANHQDFITESRESDLTLHELTPLGTEITAVGQYGDARNLAANGGIGKPGFTVSGTQPLYIFVKNSVLRTRRLADISFANAKNTFEATVLSLRSQGRSLYYQVILGEESIRVQERAVTSARKVLDVTEALVRAGKSPPVETTRVKIRLQTAQRQFQNAEVARNKAVLNAKQFILLPLNQPVHFTSQLQFKPMEVPLDRLIQYAFLHNPGLQTLRRNQESAQLTYDASVEPTRPTFSLSGSYGDHEIPSAATHNWSWTGGASWLFFDSFVTRDQARIARIGQWVADLNMENGEQTLRVNIESRYLDIKNAEKQIIDFAGSQEQSRRDVDVVRLRFRNGLDRLVDVFNAEDQMLALDNEYLGLLVSYNQAKDSLSELVGGDVERIR